MTKRVPTIDFDDKNGQVLDNVFGEIILKNVLFIYPSKLHTNIFHKFCLTVHRAKLALDGSSSFEKSIVISLLERFLIH